MNHNITANVNHSINQETPRDFSIDFYKFQVFFKLCVILSNFITVGLYRWFGLFFMGQNILSVKTFVKQEKIWQHI